MPSHGSDDLTQARVDADRLAAAIRDYIEADKAYRWDDDDKAIKMAEATVELREALKAHDATVPSRRCDVFGCRNTRWHDMIGLCHDHMDQEAVARAAR